MSDAEDAGDASGGLTADAAFRYLEWAAFLLLGLLAVISTVQLYTNTSRAISEFVAPGYVAVFQAGFNLVVLLLALAGIVVLVRRLRPR